MKSAPALNPASISVRELSRILSTFGDMEVTEAAIKEDLAEGAPQNADGTINLVHFAAWTVKQMQSK